MEKLERLKQDLSRYETLCIGFSGGVDSTFLLQVAKETLNERVFAIIVNGVMLADRDLKEAVRLAEEIGVTYAVLDVDALAIPEFQMNDKRRCYFCKTAIFSAILDKAKSMGATHVADGKNVDDLKVYRPGIQATDELGIVSPLYMAGFTKKDIREASALYGLSTASKPANACLATRFPYDTELTVDRMRQAEQAEDRLAALCKEKHYTGATRVRIHGELARIEAPLAFCTDDVAAQLVRDLKEIGFRYVTLDLEGFRSGSMD